jgi:glycosyltransferase involved in cell wall biosynthesis
VPRVINVMLATAPGVNVGMAAVELGLLSFAADANIRAVPRGHPALLRHVQALPQGADIRRRMDVGLGERVPLETIPSVDHGPLLYWGDFHHMKQYIDTVAAIDGARLPRTLELQLAAGSDPALMRSVRSFGSTVIFNSARDMATSSYRQALERFVDGCAGLWLRDPISTAMLARLSDRGHVHLGVDAALLAARPDPSDDTDAVAVFLGRTSAAHPALVEVVKRVQRHMGCCAKWLDWGCLQAFPHLASPAIRDELGGITHPRPPAAVEVLAELSGARAVVTDSYHLALIAWSWGIPAITISTTERPDAPPSVDGGRPASWRDKRELAASQYGALEFLIRRDQWSTPQTLFRATERMLEVLDSGLIEGVKQAIAADTRNARAQLLTSFADQDSRDPRPAQPRPGLRAAAVVTIRNEARHVDGLVRNLVREGLDIVVIDQESTDESLALIRRWEGHGVLWVETQSFEGVFDLHSQLCRKREVIARLDHDWVMHLDADEWPHPVGRGDRLIDLFARAEQAGDTVVNFDEFTFVPEARLGPDEDPREVFCRYYYFAPSKNRLMRAWRRDVTATNSQSGGHRLVGDDVSVHGEQAILRHYPTLSLDHAVDKYVRRIYAAGDIKRGWHGNRLGLTDQDFTLRPHPALRRLDRWDSRNFDRSAPIGRHYWEWNRDQEPIPTAG